MTRTVQPLTWITATALVLWLLVLGMTCCADSQAEQSTVLVEINTAGSPITSKLTGVVVGSTDGAALVATCAHGWRGESAAARVTATREDGSQAVGRRVWTGDPDVLDVALVRVATRAKWPISPIISRTPAAGEQLWTIGYPQGSRRQTIRQARYLGVSGTQHAGYATSTPIWSGESGSPVIAVDGVVGLVWGYDERHIAMATPARRWAGAVEAQCRQWRGGVVCRPRTPAPPVVISPPVVPIVRPPPARQQYATVAQLAAAEERLKLLIGELEQASHGLDGQDGLDGSDGLDGQDGLDGKSPTINYAVLAEAVAGRLQHQINVRQGGRLYTGTPRPLSEPLELDITEFTNQE